MTKIRKVDILYRMAKGQDTGASLEELQELRKYKISAGDDADYATRANITNYVAAVDSGYYLSFYDWCANNLQGDRRRKGGKEGEIAAANKQQSMATLLMGWLVWGIAIYWMLHGSVPVGACAVAGAIVAFILQKCFRRAAPFTIIILPIVIAVICAKLG